MNTINKKAVLTIIYSLFIAGSSLAQAASFISLQALIDRLGANNEVLKSGQSQIQARQAAVKETAANRMPNLNTMYQATVGSDNNVNGPYLGFGILPSVTGGSRTYSNISPLTGNTALAGATWEAINFGEYKAENDLARANLLAQNSRFAKTQYDLNGIASAYYIELLRQYELTRINQENVARLRQLFSTISTLITNGIRPGVDSSIASSELSKSLVALYEAQKVFEQIQSQLSDLTRLPGSAIMADTAFEDKVIGTGPAFVLSAAVDTAHHPDIALLSSLYDQSRAQFQLDRKRFYPKIFLDADAWTRGSSLTGDDHYDELSQGLTPQRLDYFVGVTMTYDILNIVRKRLSSNVSKYESESSAHQLEQARIDINSAMQQAVTESSYQLKKLNETNHQLQSAYIAYGQQTTLYDNGLSNIIDLDIALSYYIQAEKDNLDAKVNYMRSILNYSLVTNSFNSLVQTLKL